MFIDTYSNLKKAQPIFHKKNGDLTAYALHCGYFQEKKTTKARIEIYNEHCMYHVRAIKNNFPEVWETCEKVNDAWSQYRKLLKQYQ